MESNVRQITSADLFFFQKSFNKPCEFLLYETNRLHFSVCVCVCVCTVIVHRRRHSVKEESRRSTSSRTCLFFTRCDVICDLLQYTYTEKCNLFVKYKIII